MLNIWQAIDKGEKHDTWNNYSRNFGTLDGICCSVRGHSMGNRKRKGLTMNRRTHREEMVALLQEILASKNARYAAQHKLYTLKASLLTKRK